jgi:hypothetical protein|tara:strand:+ start:1378 stop:2466 length:1089 start_codon:yes stop_codon:yes gene_type:complete
MRALLLSLILLLATTINCYASNSVFITQIDQTGGSVFIKQDGANNTFGVSANNPFVIDGNKLTVIIRQIGNSNVTDYNNHLSFKGTNMTFDYTAIGNSNKLRPDIDDVDAEGHYYDHDITGNSNVVDYDTWADDTTNFNVDLDIYGDSNTFWIQNRGDGHFLYVRMSGDSNTVEWYSTTDSVGFNTNANKAIGPQTASHSQFADSSGSEGASADIYIVGNSNVIHTSSYGTGNYQLHDFIGNSNLLDIHSSYTGDDTDPYGDSAIISGDNNWLRTIINGDDNTIRLHMAGGNNIAKIFLYTDDSVINFAQTGGSNDGKVTITGDSIYDYTLNFSQNGSDSCIYSYNRNTQTADVTATVSNGC